MVPFNSGISASIYLLFALLACATFLYVSDKF